MYKSTKKKLKPADNETIIPLGFCEDEKVPLIFCKTKEAPENIFTTPNIGRDFNYFSKERKPATFMDKNLVKKVKPENIENIVSSKINGKKVITYTYKKGSTKYLYWALSNKSNEWLVQGRIMKITERGGIISDYTHEKHYFVFYGEHSIHTAFSKNFIDWEKGQESVLRPRPGFFDKHGLKFIATKITPRGILVFYDSSVKTTKDIKIQIGMAMFSLSDPHNIIWRTDEPIFEARLPLEKDFECKGMLFKDEQAAIYWHSKDIGLVSARIALPFAAEAKKGIIKKLERHNANPLICPKTIKGKDWMSVGAFNPAAIVIKNKTHLLFRAIGDDGISRVGHSASTDGIKFKEICPEPVFYLKRSHFGMGPKTDKYNPVLYPSGGSWGGCEDPRVVKVDDKIYMTFNAFDGWDFIRVGYTSIKEEDFVKGNWNWTRPKLISPAGEIHKNWVIFPEKINGKFAILHSLTPEIQIDYVDKLEDLATGKQKITSIFGRKAPRRMWDTWIRGAGPPPVKTPDGWLVFYHAVSANESHKYKLGVMLLDLNDPKKILARSSAPILLPDMWYENDWKPGIVYACGAVVRDDTLYIYYGGGDKFVCVATVPFKEFMAGFKNVTECAPFISKVIFT